MAKAKTAAPKKAAAPRKPKKVKAAAGSVGLTADEVASGSPSAEVTKLDMKIEGGKVVAYRAKVSLSFKYEA